jgi:hypothetical protein
MRVPRDDHETGTTGPFRENLLRQQLAQTRVDEDGGAPRWYASPSTSAPLLPPEEHVAGGLLPKALTS